MNQLPIVQRKRLRSKRFITTAIFVLLILALGPSSFASTYFIRPFLNFSGGATIDGLKVDAETSGSQFFSDASRTGSASVNLRTGQISAFGEIVGFDDTFVITTAIMSDTFTLRSGAGTNFNFNFAYDGTMTADAKSIAEDPGTYLLQMSASLAIFRPGVAEWNNWFGLASNTDQEIFFENFNFTITNPMEDVFETIDDVFNFNTILASDFEQFQVFVRLETLISTRTPQTVELDFGNTGTLGFVAAPNVEVFSGSGVFPNTKPIPEPSTVLLAVLGVGLFALRRCRNRSGSTV